MSIAVIIVNYGTPDLSISAVESVLSRNHSGREIEVHLLDNNSPGDDGKRFSDAHTAKGWGDRVTLWFETENHGFGRGNNVVLRSFSERATPPEFVFFLNPDAELENEAIAILAGELDANPSAGVAGAGISFPDGSPAACAFRFPSFLGECISAINFGPLERFAPNTRVSLPADWPEGPVDWVAGAAMLIRFDALQSVNFFDPDFFLYFEEVDLMRRLLHAGYQTLYVPRARVIHIAGAATQVRSGEDYPKPRPAYLYDSWRMYFQKSHGRVYTIATALMKLPAATLGNVISRLRGRRSRLPGRFFRDHCRYVLGPLLTGRVE